MDDQMYASLRYRNIGPNRGGRVVAVAGDPDDVTRFYFGSTGGGVWKTDDGGQIWENISDGFFKYASVGAIQVSESDPNVIYVGMGEATIRGNVSRGDGIYKSTDRGRTWQHKGLAETQNIGELQIHPENPDIVYVAALGHVWGENPERGLYRSTDGGDSWELILKQRRQGRRDRRPARPDQSRIVYAAIWESGRGPTTCRAEEMSPVSGARSTAATPGKTSPTTRDSRKASSARSPWRRHRPGAGGSMPLSKPKTGAYSGPTTTATAG
ncbi:MAG: hypothetical protein R3A46_00990 [Thermomicrobiales bacterium]